MEIATRTWHYRLFLFAFRTLTRHPFAPRQMGICTYGRWLLFGVPAAGVLQTLRAFGKAFWWCVLAILWILWAFTMPFFGRLPTSLDTDDWRWYKPFRIGLARFYPAQVIALGVCARVGYELAMGLYPENTPLVAIIGTVIFISVMSAFTYAIGHVAVRRWIAEHEPKVPTPSEPKPPSLLVAYLRAKLDGFCPTVRFTD